jgi:lysophospholipase L1-like esterase
VSGASTAHDGKTVVLFGASRMEMWDPKPGGPGWRVVRCGISGQTSAQARERLGRDLPPLGPDLVVVQTGLNDLTRLPRSEEHRRRAIEACAGNLRTICDGALATGARVLLLLIFPPGSEPEKVSPKLSGRIAEATADVNAILRTYQSDRITVLDCNDALADGALLKPAYADGQLHLNREGYEALNRVVVPAIAVLLGDV